MSSVIRPFPGLQYFSAKEAHLFFGREGQSDELVRKLAASRFLAVVGTSGCGKSSLIRAGLFPALMGGYMAQAGAHWRFAEMHPGSDPIQWLSLALGRIGLGDGPSPDELRTDCGAIRAWFARKLAGAGADSAANLLIFADQFEELFRYDVRAHSAAADRDEKAMFVQHLIETFRQREAPIYVVLAMRAEFLGECARFRDLAEEMNEAQYLVPRLTRKQRRRAIEAPVSVANASISPKAVQRILNDCGDDPDQLPLMQHALMQTWDRWLNRREPHDPSCRTDEIEVQDYVDIGGIENALSKHAGEVFNETAKDLGPRGPEIIKRILLLLYARDEKGREIRRPSKIAEMMAVAAAPLEDVQKVIRAFSLPGRKFLVTSDEALDPDTDVDVIHECLLRKWDMLTKYWAPEELESQRIYVKLAQRAADAAPELLSGSALRETSNWWNTRKPNEAWALRYQPGFEAAQKFLQTSRRIERRQLRRRYVLPAAAALLVAAAIFLFIVFRQSRQITVQLLAAKAALTFSESDSLLQQSGLLAASSLRLAPTLDAQVVLSRVVSLLPSQLPPLRHPGAAFLVYSEDGKYLASGDPSGLVIVWRIADSAAVQRVAAPGKLNALAWAGSRLLLGGDSGAIRVASFESGSRTIDLECKNVKDIAADAGGEHVAAICDAQPKLWTYDSKLKAFKPSPLQLPPAALLRQASESDKRRTRKVVWKPTRIALGRFLDSQRIGLAGELAFENYDSLLGWGPTSVQLLAVRGNSPRRWYLKTIPGGLADMRFLPYYGGIGLAYTDGSARTWDFVGNGDAVQLRPSDPGDSGDSDDSAGYALGRRRRNAGAQLVSLSVDASFALTVRAGVARLWRLENGSEVSRAASEPRPRVMSLHPNAAEAAAIVADGRILRWNLTPNLGFAPHLSIHPFYMFPGMSTLVQSNYGALFSVTGEDAVTRGYLIRFSGTGSLVSLGRIDVPLRINPQSTAVLSIPYSIDSLLGRRTSITLHALSHADAGHALWRSELPPSGMGGAAFSPDGKLIAVLALPNPEWIFSRRESGVKAFGLRIIESSTGKLLHSWSDPGVTQEGDPYSPTILVGFSADGKMVIMQYSGHIVTFKIQTGEGPVERVPLRSPALGRAAATSADGSLLAVADSPPSKSEDESIAGAAAVVRVFDTGTWREVGQLEHPESVSSIMFSSDNKQIVTTALDDSVRVWDWSKQQELARVSDLTGLIAAARMPDGRLSVIQRSRVGTYRVDRDGLIGQLCGRVTRNLTPDEWRRYAGDAGYFKVCQALP
jgi:WD40 repeat protein